MFNVRLASGHLYGKQLFTWLSLVVSLMASFVLSFFPLGVLDEIGDLIELVSEGFLTYFYNEFSSKSKFFLLHNRIHFGNESKVEVTKTVCLIKTNDKEEHNEVCAYTICKIHIIFCCKLRKNIPI